MNILKQKSTKRSPPQSSLPNDDKEMTDKFKKLEVSRKEMEQKESQLNEKEKLLLKREATLNEQVKNLDDQKRAIKEKEDELAKQRVNLDASSIKASSPKTAQLETELNKLKAEHVSKEKKFQEEAKDYLMQIE